MLVQPLAPVGGTALDCGEVNHWCLEVWKSGRKAMVFVDRRAIVEMRPHRPHKQPNEHPKILEKGAALDMHLLKYLEVSQESQQENYCFFADHRSNGEWILTNTLFSSRTMAVHQGDTHTHPLYDNCLDFWRAAAGGLHCRVRGLQGSQGVSGPLKCQIRPPEISTKCGLK